MHFFSFFLSFCLSFICHGRTEGILVFYPFFSCSFIRAGEGLHLHTTFVGRLPRQRHMAKVYIPVHAFTECEGEWVDVLGSVIMYTICTPTQITLNQVLAELMTRCGWQDVRINLTALSHELVWKLDWCACWASSLTSREPKLAKGVTDHAMCPDDCCTAHPHWLNWNDGRRPLVEQSARWHTVVVCQALLQQLIQASTVFPLTFLFYFIFYLFINLLSMGKRASKDMWMIKHWRR